MEPSSVEDGNNVSTWILVRPTKGFNGAVLS